MGSNAKFQGVWAWRCWSHELVARLGSGSLMKKRERCGSATRKGVRRGFKCTTYGVSWRDGAGVEEGTRRRRCRRRPRVSLRSE